MRQVFIDALTNVYDRQRFKKFSLEFLNELALAENKIEVDKQFQKHIDGLTFLGNYEDSDNKKFHVLEVKLKTDSKLEQARTMQRNLVAKYLKDHWLDGAFVAFYTESSPSWRLSFVKIEYRFDEKGKTKEELTPAKRYSFLVGKDEPTHTAQTQLYPIYIDTSRNPTLNQIEETFSVERVTKEFFEKYRELFEDLYKELKGNHTFLNEASKNNIDIENFAKKLLGQIVFLYFLQKKGWLGVPKGKSWGEGDKHFLRHLYLQSQEKNENFFNSYLEPLFYDTLNNPRSNRVDRNYSERFDSKIPFLNGGLFEPQYDWKDSLMYLDNKMFSQILDVFDLYNFTVKEDEPLEKEVAVDPEMLGKVFENLIEENLRKGKGTYYTPREIVHYMCQESLINYLTTEAGLPQEIIRDFVVKSHTNGEELTKEIKESKGKIIKALKTIKIVDPACGSGAFLVGMLQEIVKTRLELEANSTEYQVKKESIQNAIYGVDIDPGATEIAKLRLWLSLVVDYDLEQIEPLPNLDYKIMQGNSLLEDLVLGDTSVKLYDSDTIQKAIGSKRMKNLFDQENQIGLFDEDREKVMKSLKNLQLKYFSASDTEVKKRIRNQVEKIERDLIETSVKSSLEELRSQKLNIRILPGIGLLPEDAKRLEKISSKENQIFAILDELKKTGTKPFFLWHLYFADVFEEKGGFDIVIANPPYIFSRELITENEKKYFYKIFRYTQFKINTYILFVEKSYHLLNEKGNLIFIIPNNWLTLEYSSEFRHFILTQTYNIHIINIAAKVFDSASVDNSILFFRKKGSKSIVVSEMSDHKIKHIINDSPERFLNNHNYIINYDVNDSDSKSRISRKITIKGVPLNQIAEVKNGVQAYTVGEGMPIQTKEMKLKRVYHNLQKIDDSWIKYVDGIDVGRYYLGWSKQFIKYGKNLSRPRRFDLFQGERVLVRQIPSKPPYSILASYVKETLVNDNNSMIIKIYDKLPINTKYLLSILNSKLMSFWFIQTFGKLQRKIFPQFKVNELRIFPVYIADLSKHDEKRLYEDILTHVNSILDLPPGDEQNQEQRDSFNQNQKIIDECIYRLYDLEPEEINIIEGNHG